MTFEDAFNEPTKEKSAIYIRELKDREGLNLVNFTVQSLHEAIDLFVQDRRNRPECILLGSSHLDILMLGEFQNIWNPHVHFETILSGFLGTILDTQIVTDTYFEPGTRLLTHDYCALIGKEHE